MINIRYSILFKIERKRKYFSYKKKKVSIVSKYKPLDSEILFPILKNFHPDI